jgi:hypothetical protein
MLNERPTEPDGWKNKLDRLDNLPGEPWTGKSAAWDTLYARMHQKPKRKAGPWWLAAAIFGLLVLISFLLTYKKAPPLVKNNSLPVHVEPPAPAPVLPERTASVPFARRSPAESALVIKSTPVNNNHQPAIKPRVPQPAGLPPGGNSPPDTMAMLQTGTLPLATNTPLPAGTALQPKKKLQVVHINELNGPAEQDTPLVRGSNKRLFRISLPKMDMSSSASLNKQGDDYDWLKIKIPIQN